MNYLEKAVNSLFGTYYTPKKLIDKINKEKINSIIGNPKFKIKDYGKNNDTRTSEDRV